VTLVETMCARLPVRGAVRVVVKSSYRNEGGGSSGSVSNGCLVTLT
jgi:hypothetical protein